MARADILSVLYSKDKSPLEFQFDSLWMPSMYYYLSPQDVQSLYNIASSVKYSSKIELKYKEIDKIMTARGFKKFHSGTNRVVYKYLEDTSFLVKIAVDKVGLRDNPDEYRNQFLLKPFVTKTFEVSPCGTVATVERVEPITSRQEFLNVAPDVFEMLNKCILGEYVLEDIGTNYFMNYGLRKGFGVCLLDYPYLFKLDGNKLYCNRPEDNSALCGGVIDYDSGFNNLVCTKCGKRYLATELQQFVDNKLILLKGDECEMQVRLMRGSQVISEVDTTRETEIIKVPDDILKVSLSNVYSDRLATAMNNNIQKITVDMNNLPVIEEERQELPSGGMQITLNMEDRVQQNETERLLIAKGVSFSTPSGRYSVDSKFIPERIGEQEVYIEIKSEEREAVIQKHLTTPTDNSIKAFGLTDKDFEEPKDEDEKEKDSIAEKYSDLYDEDNNESFQRIKKGGSKNFKNKEIMDNY